jgi:ABC-type uncharacterized transport system ATPase subunit
MTDTVLRVAGLKVAYGGIQAVKGVDLQIQAGDPEDGVRHAASPFAANWSR